ncbi:gluconokinase [Colibacter massiliensis]|uniref:gluconokinase n=1 Tax=Colibacter massiliensis TaxID=1852379 RepID=UPI00266D2047|nr:gluconokinase [Colibacter massiliensis]
MTMDSTNQEVWIGVDVGTTGVRAIAYTAEGVNVCSAEAFYPLLTPHPDWAEESPLQIYEAVEDVIRRTASQLRYKNKELSGIALSTVMHSFAGLDKNKQPLMDMQTWADSRSAGIVRDMKLDADLCRSFYERTGCPVHACYPLAKIIWLRRHQPDLFSQMKYVGSLKDYIFRNFTGEWVIDRSAASASGLYNEFILEWDEEILQYAGISKDYMPPVVSTTYSSTLTDSAAASMGLPAGLPVVIGATDGVLVNVGIGAVNPGQLSGTIGTSGALRMLTQAPKTDKRMRTWCYNLTDDVWVAGGAVNNGGMILRWVRDKICHYGGSALESLDIDPYDLMTMKAEHVDAGADGLICLPYFTGERAPYWNSELRGMFFGFSLNHSRSHMIRAVMEGICYSLNSVMSALREFGSIEDIRVSGSFTKSQLWLQILADVLNEPITLPDNSEGAAFGAAVLGFISGGKLSGIADTASLVHPKKVYVPQAENVAVYKELFRIFERIYENLQPEFTAITAYQNKL